MSGNINRGDYIIQQDPEDELWYVQEIQLLDMGRFKEQKAAHEHWQFLSNK